MNVLKPSRLCAAAILCSQVTQPGLFLFCVIQSSSSRAVNSPFRPFACTQVTGWSWQLGLEKVQQRLWKLVLWPVGYKHLIQDLLTVLPWAGDWTRWVPKVPSTYIFLKISTNTLVKEQVNVVIFFFTSPARDISLCILLCIYLKLTQPKHGWRSAGRENRLPVLWKVPLPLATFRAGLRKEALTKRICSAFVF